MSPSYSLCLQKIKLRQACLVDIVSKSVLSGHIFLLMQCLFKIQMHHFRLFSNSGIVAIVELFSSYETIEIVEVSTPRTDLQMQVQWMTMLVQLNVEVDRYHIHTKRNLAATVASQWYPVPLYRCGTLPPWPLSSYLLTINSNQWQTELLCNCCRLNVTNNNQLFGWPLTFTLTLIST